ncbi:MAG: hypothetical protein QGH24_02420 [Candidatus Marinimicrobia bacterium]|nr:hypothetical protein [Candidatus Neomarinimicrobiota bacterium]
MKSRPFVIMGIVFGLPALVYLFFNTQSFLTSNQFNPLQSPEWLMYLIFLLGGITLYINVNSDIQEYRFNNRKIFQLILSPVSPRKIIFYLVFAVVIESFILCGLSGAILYFITGIEISIKFVIYGVPALLIYLLLLGTLFTTLSLITEDHFIYHFLSICILLICITSPGMGIFNLHTSGTSDLWQFIPTTMILNFVLFILLADVKKWSLVFIPGLVLLILLILNGELLSRKIRR